MFYPALQLTLHPGPPPAPGTPWLIMVVENSSFLSCLLMKEEHFPGEYLSVDYLCVLLYIYVLLIVSSLVEGLCLLPCTAHLVLILDGNSDIGEYVRVNFCNLIYLRHLVLLTLL